MSNVLAAAAPKIMAAGIMALRQNAVTSRLVNRSYDTQAAEIGSIIDIPISSAIASRPVAPAQVPPAGVDSVPTKASIEFDFWEEAPFYLTDKDFGDVGRSEEHTSELQSLMRISYAVFCLKNNNKHKKKITQLH